MGELKHLRATYNDIHDIIKNSAEKIAIFKPNLLVAIGSYLSSVSVITRLTDCVSGGGSVPYSISGANHL